MEEQGRPALRRVRLTGARFDGGRLPIDSLAELQKYQEIVRVAAESEWKRDHPGKDVPQDFQDSVSLAIERIDEGSADVFLAFEQHQTYAHYQVDAQEATDAVLAAAYSGGQVPASPAFSPNEAFAFRSTVAELGKTLKSGQTIEYFPDAPGSSPITISIETRERATDALLLGEDFLRNPELRTQPTGLQKSKESLVGKITAVDTDEKTYRFTLPDGQQLNGRYKNNPSVLPDLLEVVNNSAEGPLTRVSGELHTKPDGDLHRFWETTNVEQVEFDGTEWGQRLTLFAGLRTDWDGAGAEQISPVALDAAQTLLRAIDKASIERPGVFPTADGGVLLEWGSATSVTSVELINDGSFETYSIAAGQTRGKHSSGNNLSLAVEFVKAVKS